MDQLTVNFYNENASKFINNTFLLDVNALYEPFIKLLKPGAHILDAGCGSGRDALFFTKCGYIVTAFDAAEEMVKHACKTTGLEIKQMTFQEFDLPEQFDAIWACASLLHVSESEIDLVVEKLSKSLKYNGIFYSSYKYGEKEGFRHGRLFNDYTETRFKALMERHNQFDIISIWKTTDLRSGRDDEVWLNTIVRKVHNKKFHLLSFE